MQIATENSVTTEMCDDNSSYFSNIKSLKKWQNLGYTIPYFFGIQMFTTLVTRAGQPT